MELTKRHKHADVIHAYAEGAKIQVLSSNGIWENVILPMFHEHLRYRIKPESTRFRVAMFKSSCPYYWVCVSEEIARKFEKDMYFVRWLTDWIEVDL